MLEEILSNYLGRAAKPVIQVVEEMQCLVIWWQTVRFMVHRIHLNRLLSNPSLNRRTEKWPKESVLLIKYLAVGRRDGHSSQTTTSFSLLHSASTSARIQDLRITGFCIAGRLLCLAESVYPILSTHTNFQTSNHWQ